MQTITIDTLQTAILAALRAWGDLSGTPTNLFTSLLLVQQEWAKANADSATTRRLAANQVLLNAINLMQPQDPLSAQVLRLRFIDNETVLMVSNKLNLSEDQVKRRQRAAVSNLTQIIWEQETAVRQERILSLSAHLEPPSYTELFGRAEIMQTVSERLLSSTPPWIAALVGLGGIGKTAVADQIARQIITHFQYEQIIWLRISPTQHHSATNMADTLMTQLGQSLLSGQVDALPPAQRNAQIREILKTIPHLIIFDNLETETDTTYFVNTLNDLANPSKFLLTSRSRLPIDAHIYQLALPELTAVPAAALIRSHAHTIGLTELAQANDTEINRIYTAVGGNPLALKLVVGLTAILPLHKILHDLVQVQHQQVEAMYRHIYWQAWGLLSPTARLLLEMMPMAADMGMPLPQMAAITNLDEKALAGAVTELINCSLLEVRGTTWERRYSIHRLTESFLRTEIIHWPEETES